MEIIAFILYLILVLVIGLVAYTRTKFLKDYILGGRKIGSVVAALSANASDMSGWLLLGLPGLAYLEGTQAFWIAIGIFLGTYLNWQFIATPLRIHSEQMGDALTIPEYLANIVDDKQHVIRMTSAIFIIIFFTIYTSAGLVAAGKLFSTVFHISYHTALFFGILSILIYTALGGFLAVTWTDAVQATLMLFALATVPIFVLGDYHFNWSSLSAIVHSKNAAAFNMFNNADGTSISVLQIVSLIAWGLGYFGQPHILSRFMAIQSHKKIGRAKLVSLSWLVVTLVAAVMIGILGIAALEQPLTGNDSELVFLKLIRQRFHPVLAGFFLSAVLSAIMSTADSQILIVSSSLVEDLYKVLKKRASQVELLLVGRIGVVVVALIALLLSFHSNSKIIDLVAYAWAGFGAAFGPLIIVSLYQSKRLTRWGALAGIVVGGVTVIVWKQLSGGLFDLYEIVPGFIFSYVAIVLLGRIAK